MGKRRQVLGMLSAPSPTAYADFVYAAAKKFPSVHIWQVWGEPTRENNFMPQGATGAGLYARMLDDAYYALKSISASNIVIGGSTFFGGFTRAPLWIKYLRLPNGRPPHMDWYGHNPFERRFPKIKAKPIKLFRGLSDLDTLWKEVKTTTSARSGSSARSAATSASRSGTRSAASSASGSTRRGTRPSCG